MSTMPFSDVLQRFVEQRPVAVLTRLVLETQLRPAFFETVFEQAADLQYTRELAFSTAVNVLCQVTLGGQRSVHAVFRKDRAKIPVSLVALYDKLKRTEPAVCNALVAASANSITPLVKELDVCRKEPIPGYRLRIVDGNLLAGTERRLGVLRGSGAAALPGMSLVVYDYATTLIGALVACEDGHTNERAIMPDVLPHISPKDLFMADRNFCTAEFLGGVKEKKAAFLVRHHKGQKLHLVTGFRPAGKCRTGGVFEAKATLSSGLKVRVIQIRRHRPLKEGGKTVTLLTNLPCKAGAAARLATLYLSRWRIEEAFRQLTQELNCEVRTLGYPKAALLAFSLAVLAYNCLGMVKATLAAVHGRAKVDDELSSYYVADEVRFASDGLAVAIPAAEWAALVALPPQDFVRVLLRVAAAVNWPRYRKTTRGPKKPVRRTKVARGSHVATARLLKT